MGSPAHKLVYGQNYFAQLAATDATISIEVVKLEGPAQTLVNGATQQSG